MADLTKLPTELVSKLVLDLGKIPNISDKWINADVVSDLIEHYFQQRVNTTKINRVFTNARYCCVDCTKEKNNLNLYRHESKATKKQNKSSRKWYFFSSTAQIPPPFNDCNTIKINTADKIRRSA